MDMCPDCIARQKIISAFYSGLRGGRLFAEGLINILTERGIMDMCPDCIATKPFDPDVSYLDEFIAYPLFAAGYYFQFTMGFPMTPFLAFPFWLPLAPIIAIEWFLEFEIFFG